MGREKLISTNLTPILHVHPSKIQIQSKLNLLFSFEKKKERNRLRVGPTRFFRRTLYKNGVPFQTSSAMLYLTRIRMCLNHGQILLQSAAGHGTKNESRID